MNKEKYMQLALKQGYIAAKLDEVPVGVVIVDPTSGKVIAKAHNKTMHKGNPTAHAEILAIQKACQKLKINRLREMDMYVTLEPCTMCAAAISFARIHNLFIGALDPKGGAVINGVRFYESATCHHKPNIEHGICAEECSALLKSFFKNKRT
ncbi:MAG: nucleoside deaminase [Alphaproteobacteria bacterium]|nr:nucleoside deaminase [Alphaproteobacteria bacterium]